MAKRVETLGDATILISDHRTPDFFGNLLAPFAALMSSANATTSLRAETLVIDNDFRHPAVLAKEVATVELLSDGRLDLRLGAGWLQTEYDQSGIVFDCGGTRIERLEELVRVLKALFADAPASFLGKHYTIEALKGYPKPMRRPHPPIMIGGAGQWILALVAREPNIIHSLPSTISTGTLMIHPRDRLPDVMMCRIEWVREQAGARFKESVLSPSAEFVIAFDRHQFVEDNEWHDVSVEKVGECRVSLLALSTRSWHR